MSALVDSGTFNQPVTRRPRKTRTRSGCLPCRRRRKKCDGRRPICSLCETRAETCVWGLKVSFHPSRSLELSVDDIALLDAVEKERRRTIVRYSSTMLTVALQVVDETSSIARLFESSAADDSSEESEEDHNGSFADSLSIPRSMGGYDDTDSSPSNITTTQTPLVADHSLTPQPPWSFESTTAAPRLDGIRSMPRLVRHSPLPTLDAGHDDDPFSLDLSASRGTFPVHDPALPVSQEDVVSLLSAFIWETATWCETTDSTQQFSTASIHTMLQSKPFVAAAMSLASRQLDNVRCFPQQRTLELYQYSIGLLLRQDPNEPDPSVLAACTLLCVYEMMGSSVLEWRRHLKGCAGLLRMHRWNGNNEGIVKSCFWAFARIDVWAAFSLDQTTLIPTASWIDNDSVELVAASGDLDDYCNLTTLMFARTINLLNETNSDPNPHDGSIYFPDKVRASWADLQLWRRCRLQEAHPILDAEASGSNPFPTIVFTSSSSVCGNTFYHSACLLLLQTGLVAKTCPLDAPEVMEPVWHAKELGGISQSNPSQ
ncbi:putative Zn(II)2Cys6 transcription factor [Plectosphaerella plurivora]|uniref:Zn(II)2Cys6 transcription factor n=1 Tax=Plectosphaerella plurivora TaxID=936078 RepID=A0A9P9A9W0_9PEZI|nr:putative Zn(II)2Cys6 transcription factor [Plectosphaerella plurivora]